MNRGPGGSQPKMHDSVNPRTGQVQQMVWPRDSDAVGKNGQSLAGLPKGMEQICRERGLLEVLEKNGKVIGICGECKKSEAAREKAVKEAKARQEEVEGSSIPGTGFVADAGAEAEEDDLEQPTDCCMQRILSCEKDFLSEKPLLQVIIERQGHKCLFLPKFHCELNPIEMVWAQTKQSELNAALTAFPTLS